MPKVLDLLSPRTPWRLFIFLLFIILVIIDEIVTHSFVISFLMLLLSEQLDLL